MYQEVFEGIGLTNAEIAEMYGKTFEEDLVVPKDNREIVMMKDIDIFSYCEHHLALMYNMKASVAYIPNGKIIGISKIARIAEMAAKRLQLQERIGSDIAEIMQIVTGSEDVAVIIRGQHACRKSRGVKNTNAVTTTTTLRGRFNLEPGLTNKLMILLK